MSEANLLHRVDARPVELTPDAAVLRIAWCCARSWNAPVMTAEGYKPLSAGRQPPGDLAICQPAVYSGNTVRPDEMTKTIGYRDGPTELEEVLYATRLAFEAAAFGVAYPRPGRRDRRPGQANRRRCRTRAAGSGGTEQRQLAGLHGAHLHRLSARIAAEQPQRQYRPQAAGATLSGNVLVGRRLT